MLGVSSSLIATSTTTSTVGDGAVISAAPQPPPPPQEAPESGGSSEGGGGGGDMSVGGGGFSEEGERNSGGNRWPRQETLALLKIRSEMDVVFKDSSLKGPLWEEVSRKMADLGYHRSAKKCKEKFENVYKYHRRTKEGRASKADGKTYRFFDQLQALENNPVSHSNLPPPPLAATPITMAMPMRSGNAPVNPSMPTPQNHNHPFVVLQNTVVTAPATASTPAVSHFMTAPAMPLSQSQPQQQPQPSVQPLTNNLNQMNRPQGNTTTSFLSNSTSSSSTSSDEDIQRRHSKKRKWKEFFESLMKDVIEKQEELQKKFLETLEKRERDRLMREETWRVQEMARLNREHDLLVQERSMAAAKDATIIAFLQKITEQQNTPIPNSTNITSLSPSPFPSPSPAQIQLKLSEKPLSTPPQPPPAIAVSLPMTIHTPVPTPPQALSLPVVSAKSFEPPQKTDNGGDNFSPASSSRWPKEEIEALISLRTCLDLKYQENGSKGPLWEEISSGMQKIGYNRNAKRCKEKWENINKYFKKVKESNKKRPEDSKTCPYFHQLEALYKEKAKNEAVPNTAGLFGLIKPESNTPIVPPPIMAQPEQQWPIPPNPKSQQQQNQQNRDHHDNESDNNSMDQDEEEEDEDDYDEEDEGNNGYEIVTNKQQTSSMAASTVTTTVSAAATATTAV